jgi:uncharacterized protein (DUF1501 family)
MKRRDFLKATSATLLPIALNGLPINTFAGTPLLKAIAKSSSKNGRVLVLIQLNGGNDGLNTLIPIDQYSKLNTARSNVLIKENRILPLEGTDKTGFHPSMLQMKNMFDHGFMSVIQDVGYPNPDFSHFRSTDIWMSGSSSDEYLKSGWLGRMLENEYPEYPDEYPNAEMPDPLALQIGYGLSLTLVGEHHSMGLAVSDTNYIYQMVNGTVDPAPPTPAGHELTYIRLVAQQTEAYSVAIKNAAEKGNNLSTKYPNRNSLADQLKIVAKLISGGLKTPVYMVSIGGFDTHANQVDASDTAIGAHANLLTQVSEAISAFQDDCSRLGIADKVCGMTFSEFGRRIKSNGSIGTDHGTAAPMFVFGSKVNPGIIGQNPNIPSNATVNDNLPMQYDYRQVYWTIIKDWFQIADTEIQNNILFNSFTPLPIFSQTLGLNKTEENKEGLVHIQCYPNPFTSYTMVEFYSFGGYCEIKLFDNQGKQISTLSAQVYPKGKQNLKLDSYAYKPGNYYLQIITALGRKTIPIIKV